MVYICAFLYPQEFFPYDYYIFVVSNFFFFFSFSATSNIRAMTQNSWPLSPLILQRNWYACMSLCMYVYGVYEKTVTNIPIFKFSTHLLAADTHICHETRPHAFPFHSILFPSFPYTFTPYPNVVQIYNIPVSLSLSISLPPV